MRSLQESFHLILLDATDGPHDHDTLTPLLLEQLVTGAISCGGLALNDLVVGIAAHGPLYLFEPLSHERRSSIACWAVELRRWLQMRTSASIAVARATASPPGVHALGAHLAQHQGQLAYSRVTFVTSASSSSCNEAALRRPLETLERLRPDTTLELVCLELGERGPTQHHQVGPWSGRLPSTLFLLQGEFNFSVSVLADRLQVRGWVNAHLAACEAVNLCLDLGGGGGDVEVDEADGRCWLIGRATPALLHDEVAIDVPACVCHGAPLDGRRMDLLRGAGAATASRGGVGASRVGSVCCPISGLALDARDQTQIGCIGRFVWGSSFSVLASSMASAQVFTDDESRRGAQSDASGACEPCVLSGCSDGAGRPRPLLALRVRSRIRLAELLLTSLYGQPWLLTGAVGGGASAVGLGGFDTGAGADSSLAAAVAAASEARLETDASVLRGLSRELHARGEALLCHGTHREGMRPHQPASMHPLLAAHLVLLPSGPPHEVLVLKSIGAPSQLVPLPPPPPSDDVCDEEARQMVTEGLARAASALSSLSLTEGFNPLMQCRGGGTAALLAHCCAAATAADAHGRVATPPPSVVAGAAASLHAPPPDMTHSASVPPQPAWQQQQQQRRQPLQPPQTQPPQPPQPQQPQQPKQQPHHSATPPLSSARASSAFQGSALSPATGGSHALHACAHHGARASSPATGGSHAWPRAAPPAPPQRAQWHLGGAPASSSSFGADPARSGFGETHIAGGTPNASAPAPAHASSLLKPAGGKRKMQRIQTMGGEQ